MHGAIDGCDRRSFDAPSPVNRTGYGWEDGTPTGGAVDGLPFAAIARPLMRSSPGALPAGARYSISRHRSQQKSPAILDLEMLYPARPQNALSRAWRSMRMSDSPCGVLLSRSGWVGEPYSRMP